MTPEALLALMEEATTPAGFGVAASDRAKLRLYDLSVALARLCVEQNAALAEIEISEPDWARGVDENCETLRTIARAALARFAALESP